MVSPVAMAWDEMGRLYVVEMTDYPTAATGGRVKRLEDRDGDGRYEHVVVFADGLRYPSGVLPWNGGVLVTPLVTEETPVIDETVATMFDVPDPLIEPLRKPEIM